MRLKPAYKSQQMIVNFYNNWQVLQVLSCILAGCEISITWVIEQALPDR